MLLLLLLLLLLHGGLAWLSRMDVRVGGLTWLSCVGMGMSGLSRLTRMGMGMSMGGATWLASVNVAMSSRSKVAATVLSLGPSMRVVLWHVIERIERVGHGGRRRRERGGLKADVHKVDWGRAMPKGEVRRRRWLRGMRRLDRGHLG